MAASNHSLSDEIAEYHDRLDQALRSYFGMTLKTFKTIKAAAQLVGAAGGIYAMRLGAPPLATFVLMTIVIMGPEGFETWLEMTK